MDTMPQHSSSPPPPGDDDEGPASEDDEFRNLGRFPVGAEGSDIASLESASKLTKLSPTLNPTTSQSIGSIYHQSEQSQITSTVSLSPISDQTELVDIHSSLHLQNEFSDAGIDQISILRVCSPTNETGFADFSVFGEETAHAWCCGLGGAEIWNNSEGVTNHSKGLSERFITSGQEVILNSEPKSFGAYKAKEDFCTKVNHCEKKNSETSSQVFHGTHAFPGEGCHCEKETLGKSAESHKEKKYSFNLNFLCSSKIAEDSMREEDTGKKEKSVSTLSQTVSLYENNASFSDDSSQEEPSEDFEPNVSSLASQEDGTDTEDQTDDEEELRNYRLSRSFCSNDFWYNPKTSTSEVNTGFCYHEQSATQESSATSIQSECESHTEDGQMFRSVSFDPHRDQEHVPLAESEVQHPGAFPPSDSFADFCSAPAQEDGEGEWALFQDQTTPVPDRREGFGPHCDLTSSQSVEQVVLCCRVQQLFRDSFPDLISADEGEDPVHRLDALLFLQNQTDHEEEEAGQGLGPQWVTPGMWWPYQDIHTAAGLQYQWGGSHTNKCLLQCLGVDTRNIVFIGIKKQPVVVPAFASHLGMLELVKDSMSVVSFPGHTAPTRTQNIQNSQGLVLQEGLHSDVINWSRQSLSSSQGGTSPSRAPHFWGRK